MKNSQAKKSIFKRWWFWVVIGVVVLALIFGKTSQNPSKENAGTPGGSTAAASNAQQTFQLNETAVFKSLKVTATEVKKSPGDRIYKPAEGQQYVGVKFTIENTSDREQSLSAILLFDAYVDGVKHEYAIAAPVELQEGTLTGTLDPGKKLVGYYNVQAPKDGKEIEFKVKGTWLDNQKATFILTL